jgi:hypothetical protein
MADIALQASAVAERQIRLVKKPSHNDQHTAPAAEAITAGAPIRQDTATGRWTNANGTSAAEARATHIAWRTVGAGEPLTGVRGCLIDGYVLDALAYDAAVYLSDTDGRLSDTAGTTSVVVGRVVGAFATLLGVAADKLLDVGSLR